MPRTTVAATAALMHNAAVRAVDDPALLARAGRIVNVALERGKAKVRAGKVVVIEDQPADEAQ